MFAILLVDDEAPALRFLQAIIGKYAPEYQIVASCSSAEEALVTLRAQRIDLLMTDISMPGMDGISLARESRALQPDIRIVIISGYAEFEYAQGAIQAAVDDYILKPVTIPHITATLDKIRAKLSLARSSQEPAILADLLSGKLRNSDVLQQFYGSGKYHFAYIRWGNLVHFNEEPLCAASPMDEQGQPFRVLQGRNPEERILFSRAEVAVGTFQTAAKSYAAQERNVPTWSLIFSRNPAPFSYLPDFVHKAESLHRHTTVIGRHQYMYLTPVPRDEEKAHIPANTLKKLEYFCQNGNKRHIKDLLFGMATDWSKRQVPQLQVYYMIQQLLHTALPFKPSLSHNQDAVYREVRELMGCAAHYGDLMVGIYTLLFDDSLDMDKKLSPEDLFSYALAYIRDNYGSPLSISQVCSEIGISQTYLSRLFRKYGNTSFNAYLTQCRMEGAMKLMQEHPDMRLRDVAACVGYEDSSYFSKVFHQMTGKTPSQWVSDLASETP